MADWTLEDTREGDYLKDYCTTWATIRYAKAGSFGEGGIFTVSIRHSANAEGRKTAFRMIDRILNS